MSSVPYAQNDDITIWVGDVRERLELLQSGSVDCVVTSPPYWALRDYGTGRWEGGDPDCDHDENAPRMRSRSTFNQSFNERWGQGSGARKQEALSHSGLPARECVCGAERVDAQLGLEARPEDYIAGLVDVFDGVRRVLKDSATIWLVLGDSYATKRWFGGMVKAKDMLGLPWRVAFALQAEGWHLRADCIWSKPNAMPEHFDRPTKSHEYVFLLSKKARYHYDGDAIREPAEWARWGDQTSPKYEGTNTKNGWMKPQTKAELRRKATVHRSSIPGGRSLEANPTGTRNARDVWEIVTQPYPEAHFAVFPEALVERCILAGCPEGGVVLDPFLGSGTTALVARRLRRRAVGIELNEEYARQALHRLSMPDDTGAVPGMNGDGHAQMTLLS